MPTPNTTPPAQPYNGPDLRLPKPAPTQPAVPKPAPTQPAVPMSGYDLRTPTAPTVGEATTTSVGGATGPDAVSPKPARPQHESFFFSGLSKSGRSCPPAAIILTVLIWTAVFALGTAVNRRADFLPDGSLFTAAHGDTLSQPAVAVSGSPSPAGLPRERGGGCAADQGGDDAVAVAGGIAVPPPWLSITDPLQRTAMKALCGKFGQLPAWQDDAYAKVMAQHLTVQGRAKRTTYCPKCDPSGGCADGSKFALGHCAANKQIAMHTILWLESDGLLKVTDRGGKVSLAYVRPGETANLDVWKPHCVGNCWTGPGTKRLQRYAIISN